jgi:hypothetical protein
MAIKKELCRSHRGIFVRNLGWKVSPTSAYRQHSSISAAMRRGLSLRVCAWSNSGSMYAGAGDRDKAYELNATDRAVWDEVTLTIA